MNYTRKYSRFELLRFLTFANENHEMSRLELLHKFDEKFPELTEKEKLQNLENALNDICPECGNSAPMFKEYDEKFNYCDACGTYSKKYFFKLT